MRLLLSNNKQVENSVNKDGMETWAVSIQLYRPESRLHRLAETFDPDVPDDSEIGFGCVMEILAPILTFTFRRVTITVYQDAVMLPPQPFVTLMLFPILQDLIELLNTGHINQFLDCQR
jgi:hypothetical protein